MKFETIAIHIGQDPDPATGAIIPPIYATSTYVQEYPGRHKGYDYSRTSNPTRKALEENLAALEGGKFGLAFSSGMGATNTILNLLKSGDHVVAVNDLYGGTYRLFTKLYDNYGLRFSFVDAQEPKNIRDAINDHTRLIWLETPTNPLLRLIDIAAVADVSHSAGHRCFVAVDNTFATPYLQQPLSLGADIVVHSTTKYIGGHSDVVGGAIVLNDEALHAKLAFFQNAVGAVPGPFDAWLVLRGAKTLAVRMERHCSNAAKIAEFLDEHPKVRRVYYPGRPSHPQHRLAARQMRYFGGMISFELKADTEQAKRFVSSTRLFALAESLGGVESLIEHPPSMTHASIPERERRKAGLNDGLIRLSVGIEHVDDLMADLDQALKKIE